MWCTALIRRFILRLPKDKLFTTRDCLSLGSRTAVDKALSRLAKSQFIIRLARGVFVKQGSQIPSLYEIAKAKAEAFGKTIIRHCADLAQELGVTTAGNLQTTFAVNGSSSSFTAGNIVVHFKHIGPRKIHLGDSKAAQAIRALWHIGRHTCNSGHIAAATYKFFRQDRHEFHRSACWAPAWLTSRCYLPPVFPTPAPSRNL